MQALRKDIEKVTRLARPKESSIIGRHMDEEFDRALPGHFSHSPERHGLSKILEDTDDQKLSEALDDAQDQVLEVKPASPRII